MMSLFFGLCGPVGRCINVEFATDTVEVHVPQFRACNQTLADSETTAPLHELHAVTHDGGPGAEEERQERELECQRVEVRRREGEEEQRRHRRKELQYQEDFEEAVRRAFEEEEHARIDEQHAREDYWAREHVNAWMRKNGFEGVHARKNYSMTTLYPLHCAVRQNDCATVQMLLKFGADPSATNSWKLTPHQLADKLNKNASHNKVLALLLPA